MSAAGLPSRLLNAFVEGLEPLVGRFPARCRLVAVEDGDTFRFYAIEKGKAAPMEFGAVPGKAVARRLKRAASGGVELRLSPERLIARSLQLPAAGREYLDSIIEHRLERLTPWRPERVVYGFAVSGEPAADGSMAVDFLATSGEIARDRAERLAALQLTPTALGSAAEPLERPLRVDLYRGSRDPRRRRLRRATGFALALIALLVLPALAVSTWVTYEAGGRLAELDQRLATKRNVLRAAAGNTDAQARDVRLIEQKRPDTATMLLVDRIATLLPDNTWLRELEIDGPKVRLAGFSADAPALIPVLEGDEALSGVRFSAPVTRDDSGRDGFDIVAQWDPLTVPVTPQDADTQSTGALP